MTAWETVLAGKLDESFIRVIGWMDDGRVRHPVQAGRLVLAARIADRMLDADHPPAASVAAEGAGWRTQLTGRSIEAVAAVAAVADMLQSAGVWKSAPTTLNRMRRRHRFLDTRPDEVRAGVAILTSGHRARDARTAVLQELVHSYAPPSSALTWWTTDDNFRVEVQDLDAVMTERLAMLFETVRAAAVPRHGQNAAASAEAGWRPTLPG